MSAVSEKVHRLAVSVNTEIPKSHRNTPQFCAIHTADNTDGKVTIVRRLSAVSEKVHRLAVSVNTEIHRNTKIPLKYTTILRDTHSG